MTELSELSKRCWAALETIHVPVYFASEPTAAYTELGIKPRAGYFVSRSSAMGAVSPEVTIATFYVFAPSLVRHVMTGCWDLVSPEQVQTARRQGVGQALHRVLGDPEVGEAAGLARELCEGLEPHGRALYAAHAALSWPEQPLLALWHAATLVREHRGDAHMAALLLSGLDPVESLVTGGITSGRTAFFRQTRGWTDEEWAAGEVRLRERGLLAGEGTLTGAGQALRDELEQRTARAGEAAWDRFGTDRATRLLELTRPLAKTVAGSDLLPAELRRR
ncbi:hypothetical protein BH20ACT5_BH20ACT5_22720 [soil metagenome]